MSANIVLYIAGAVLIAAAIWALVYRRSAAVITPFLAFGFLFLIWPAACHNSINLQLFELERVCPVSSLPPIAPAPPSASELQAKSSVTTGSKISYDSEVLVAYSDPNKRLAHDIDKILSENGLSTRLIEDDFRRVKRIQKPGTVRIVFKNRSDNSTVFDMANAIKKSNKSIFERIIIEGPYSSIKANDIQFQIF